MWNLNLFHVLRRLRGHYLGTKDVFNPIIQQAVGALGERSDKSDFSLLPWDSFSQEIRNLLLFYCQKSLNLLQMQ